MTMLKNSKGKYMWSSLYEIGIFDELRDKGDDVYNIYSVKLGGKNYKYDLEIKVMEWECSLDICEDLGVLSIGVIKSYGYKIGDIALTNSDLKDMLEAINNCEKLLLKHGIPFEKNYRFVKHQTKRTGRNLANRQKWNIEEFIKEAEENGKD